MSSDRRQQARGWVFTLNLNAALEADPFAETARALPLDDWRQHHGLLYGVYQLEVGEQGNAHFQGALYFDRKRTRAFILRLDGLVGAHLEVMRGKPEEAAAYCQKDESRVDGPWEIGDLPRGQGARTDLERAADLIRADPSGGIKRVAEEDPGTFIKYHRGLNAFALQMAPQRSTPTCFFVLYGCGGVGKSETARHFGEYLALQDEAGTNGRLWELPAPKGSGTYWDGYRQGDTVIINEMDGSRFRPGFFKQLVDRGPMQVPIHHGTLEFNSRYIIATTNIPPTHWWKDLKGGPAAIKRRILAFPVFHHRSTARPRPAVNPFQGPPQHIVLHDNLYSRHA